MAQLMKDDGLKVRQLFSGNEEVLIIDFEDGLGEGAKAGGVAAGPQVVVRAIAVERFAGQVFIRNRTTGPVKPPLALTMVCEQVVAGCAVLEV